MEVEIAARSCTVNSVSLLLFDFDCFSFSGVLPDCNQGLFLILVHLTCSDDLVEIEICHCAELLLRCHVMQLEVCREFGSFVCWKQLLSTPSGHPLMYLCDILIWNNSVSKFRGLDSVNSFLQFICLPLLSVLDRWPVCSCQVKFIRLDGPPIAPTSNLFTSLVRGDSKLVTAIGAEVNCSVKTPWALRCDTASNPDTNTAAKYSHTRNALRRLTSCC